jgi:hypothetical protein
VTIWFDWTSETFPAGGDDVVSAVDWVWHRVQPSWAVRAMYLGKCPPLLPWDYLTVRVGYDLGWYVDPPTGQVPGGLAPWRVDVPRTIWNPWHRPTCYVDADNGRFPTALAVAKTSLHELGHMVGLDEDDDTQDGLFGKRWLMKFRAGCQQAAASLDTATGVQT